MVILWMITQGHAAALPRMRVDTFHPTSITLRTVYVVVKRIERKGTLRLDFRENCPQFAENRPFEPRRKRSPKQVSHTVLMPPENGGGIDDSQ